MNESVDYLIVTIHQNSVSWNAVSGIDTVRFGGDPAETQADKEMVIDELLSRFPNAKLDILFPDGIRLIGRNN